MPSQSVREVETAPATTSTWLLVQIGRPDGAPPVFYAGDPYRFTDDPRRAWGWPKREIAEAARASLGDTLRNMLRVAELPQPVDAD